MRSSFYILCFLAIQTLQAQQLPMYVQYEFNKAGLNPAASGSEPAEKLQYLYGLGRQWTQVPNAPKTNFVNVSYTLKSPRAYKYWQNFGMYFENRDAGLMGTAGIYGSYTFHYLLQKKNTLSLGIMGGARYYSRDASGFDRKDPAVINSVDQLWVYPDIIPGLRYTSKTFFVGLSAKQLSIPALKNFTGRKIGSPSKLQPSLYIDLGKLIELGDQALMVPSMALNLPLIAPPTLDAGIMWYFMNRFGCGASVRNAAFVSGIAQIRFLQSMTVGFAYSYPLSQTRFASGTTFEVMIGVVPFGMSNKIIGRNSIARCPTLSY